MTIEPELTKTSEQLVVGVAGILRQGRHINRPLISQLWQQLAEYAPSQPDWDRSERLAVITGDVPGMETATATYFAGYRASMPAPADHPALETRQLPAGTWLYAVHQGPPWTLSQTAHTLFSQWLPDHHMAPKQSLEVCIYPADYDRNDPVATFRYGLPVAT